MPKGGTSIGWLAVRDMAVALTIFMCSDTNRSAKFTVTGSDSVGCSPIENLRLTGFP